MSTETVQLTGVARGEGLLLAKLKLTVEGSPPQETREPGQVVRREILLANLTPILFLLLAALPALWPWSW